MRPYISRPNQEFIQEVKARLGIEADSDAVNFVIRDYAENGLLESARLEVVQYIRIPLLMVYFILGLFVGQQQQQRRSKRISALLKAVAELEDFP